MSNDEAAESGIPVFSGFGSDDGGALWAAFADDGIVSARSGLRYVPRLIVEAAERLYRMEGQTASSAKFSVFAIIAIVAAILSFTTGAILGLVFAAVAILFGVIGMISASRSSVRGGFVGMLSIFAGIVGIIAAVMKAIAWFF